MALNISLKSKKVLVTGASRGLGHDLVKALYTQEAIIFALAVNPDNLAKLKDEFPNITTICADLSDWNATRKAVEEIGPIDCLVNNAAIGIHKPFVELTEEMFDNVFSVNLKSVFNISQVVVKGMIEAGIGGSIVNVSSIMSKRVIIPRTALYSTSKAGLDMLTKNMAAELGKHNIRVNGVNPGIFESDMTRPWLTQFPDGGPEYQARCPMKRISNTQEIVNTIIFLLSDAAPMVNGENLVRVGL